MPIVTVIICSDSIVTIVSLLENSKTIVDRVMNSNDQYSDILNSITLCKELPLGTLDISISDYKIPEVK